MKSKNKNLIINIAISFLSILLTFFALEMTYRLKLKKINTTLSYRVTPKMYVDFDDRHGEKFRQNSECWVTFVQDGQVVYGTVTSRSNKNGLGGKTTISEYESSDYKILIFGDSFTHWNQKDSTWPDLLQNLLNKSTNKNIAVLNYARGTYGVLQMLSLAADKVQEHKPDLVIIAAIHDDFTRDRWWCKEIEWQGYRRWMISSKKDEFSDYRYAVDEVLINPLATKDWCVNILKKNQQDDEVLRKLNEQYLLIKKDVEKIRKQFQMFQLDRSLLISRIINGHPYKFASRTIPRLSINDYSKDVEAVVSCQKLLTSRAMIKLVYLPTQKEIENKNTLLLDQSKMLMNSLEKMLKTKFIFLQEEINLSDYGAINLEPYDGHPSYEGLLMYAQTLKNVLLSSHLDLHFIKSL